jgi:hypothetical protein
MKGFDLRWKDLPDHIIGITREIWEDRGIATLHRTYTPDLAVRSPGSVVVGKAGVIAATIQTLAEFPDRTLLGEDVIWSGDAEAGFLSSHRILSTATHAGEGAFGPPTGRRLVYRIIADCAARENAIFDEWLIRDQGAIVRQLGLDPRRHAADRIAAEGGPNAATARDRPVADLHRPRKRRPGRPTLCGNPHPHHGRGLRRHSAGLRPGGVTGHGWEAADGFWMRLRAAFRTRSSGSSTRSDGAIPTCRPTRRCVGACGAGIPASAPSARRVARTST